MIDFAAIADQFRAGFAVQTHGWPTLFDRMDKLLDGLSDRTRDAERATRAYPVLRYRDGAVGVRLALGPGALLGPIDGTGRSLGEGLADGGRAFIGGFGRIGTMAEQELALPRTASVLADMVGVVDASLARFDRADPSMFDDRARRFSDVFGLLGLGWRALQGGANQDQLRRSAFRLGHGVDFLRSLSAPEGSGSAASAGRGGADGLGAALEAAAELTLGAVVLLPTAGLALDVLVEAGAQAAEEAMIRGFGTAEQEVFRLRDDIVDAWLSAFDVGTTLHHLTSAAELVLDLDAALLTGAVPTWLDGILDGVEDLLRGVRAWAVWTTAMIGAFQVATTDLMGVNLMPWVVRNVLNDWVADHVPLPSVTLDDVVRLATGEGNLSLRDDLDDFFGAVDTVLAGVDLVHDVSGLRRKAADLRQVFNLTLSPTPFTYPPDVLPTGPLAGFPDVYAAVFGGTARADLVAAVRGLGTELQRSVHDVGTASAGLAAGLAGAAETELRWQSAHGAGLRLAERWTSEGAIVAGLMGPLRADALASAPPTEPLGNAFDESLVGPAGAAGIAAVTRAIPAYVGEMRRYWSARSTRAEHPTSAHILARHGRLGMVRVPRLTLGAPDRTPDAELAAAVADAFQGVVVEAYRDGRARLALASRAGGGARHGR